MDKRRVVGGLLGVAVLLGAVLVITQRGDDEHDRRDQQETVAEAPAPLTSLWSTQLSTSVIAGPPARRVGDLIVLRSNGSYVGVDATTGERRWTHRVRGELCAASSAPESVAVYVSGRRCTTMTALDLTTGQQRWRRQVPRQNVGGVNLKVEVGDRAVTLRGSCDQILRFRRSDGHDLGVLAPYDRVCGHETDTNGQLVAVWYDPETDATPDDHGTGWIAPYDGAAALQLWDADTGKMLWTRTRDRRGGGLKSIVSGKPLVLTTTQGGQTTMRRFDARTGRAGRHVGLRLAGRQSEFTVYGQAGGTLVGRYGGVPVAYRLADGREAWHGEDDWSDGDRVIGVDDAGVLVSRTVPTRHGGTSESGTWIQRRDLADGRSLGALGWISGAVGQTEVVGDLLLVRQTDGTVTAYALGEADPDLEMPTALPTGPDWQEGDVTSLPATVACPIAPATVRRMGFAVNAGPPPADCWWDGGSGHLERHLQGAVQLASPVVAKTASEEAARSIETWLEDARDHQYEARPLPDPVPVAGLGDEAWVVTGGTPDRLWSETELVVRVRNVVVTVKAHVEALIERDRAAAAPLAAVEEATLLAARDLFAAAGIDLTTPAAGADGDVVRARGLCDLIAADAASLVPGVRAHPIDAPRRTDPDHRATGCVWDGGDYRPELVVTALAAQGSPLSGRGADEIAKAMVGRPGKDDRRIRGLGDQALLNAFTFEKGRSRTQTVTARRGNLVVAVEYGAWDQYGAAARKRMDDEAIRIARKILKAHR